MRLMHSNSLDGESGFGMCEVPRVLFLGICLVFYYVVTWVMFPKFGLYFSRRMVAEALVQAWFVSPIHPSNVAISTSTTSFQVRV